MSTSHDAAGSARRAPVREQEAALEARLRALGRDLDDGPAPAFRAATRDRLVAMAAVRSPQPATRRAGTAPRLARWRTRLAAAVAGAALTVTAMAALVAFSADARPGDALYGLKRGTEHTQLALAGDERGLTLLGFATTRLQELDALADDAAPPADVVRDTLATMDAQTTEGATLVLTRALDTRDPAPLSVLDGWAREQGSGLSDLRTTLPPDAGDAATASLGLVSKVGTRAADLQAALTCSTGPATRGTDELGPVPASCATAGTPAPATPSPAAPGDPGTPTADPPAGGAGPAAPSGAPVPAPATPPGGTGGSTGSPGAVPTTGGVPVPTTTAPSPAPPLPLPSGDGGSTSPAPTTTTPPLLETPVEQCLLPPVLC